MDSGQTNPRNMTDDEIMEWMGKWMKRVADERGCAEGYGVCSFQAVKNPVRRKILAILKEKPAKIKEISESLGLAGSKLKFHLNFLENSEFIEIKGNVVDLTPGGVSFIRNDRRNPLKKPSQKK